MTGNPFIPNSRWEALKMVGYLIFVAPIVMTKESIQESYKKVVGCKSCKKDECGYYDHFIKKCNLNLIAKGK